jgi:hypothetical protein
MSLLNPGISCAEVTHAFNDVFAERDLLQELRAERRPSRWLAFAK